MLKNATADDRPTLENKFKTIENFFFGFLFILEFQYMMKLIF